jgi:hypothetical protein
MMLSLSIITDPCVSRLSAKLCDEAARLGKVAGHSTSCLEHHFYSAERGSVESLIAAEASLEDEAVESKRERP